MSEVGPVELAAGAPWLASARSSLARSLKAGRLPHALLLQGLPGLGKAALAEWLARLALCDDPGATPCGTCVSCRLHAAGTHPDLVRVGLVEDRKQIAVDDIRELTARLGLKSFRGGRKVGIVDPADAMNANGANALLKTLEEPPPGTLLILTVARPDRLPATVASRCQRLAIAVPVTAVALAWLAEQAGADGPEVDWRGPLALAAGAPLGALRLAERGGATLDRDMAEIPRMLSQGDADLVGLAERFQQHLPAERLRWMENWVTERIRKGLTAPVAGHTPANTGLPAVGRTRHIQALFVALDELRAAQAALGGSANVALLWERLLALLAQELAGLRAGRAVR
jgi:DNA polymerase III subunit delta'